MKSKVFICFFLCVSALSCRKIIDSVDAISKEEVKLEDLKEIKVNNLYSISVPSYMKEMTSLNDDASFEYANLFKETYTIVIDENKEEFIKAFKDIEIYNDSLTVLENYSGFQINSLKEDLNTTKANLLSYKKGNASEQYEINGRIDNVDIAYLIGFVEGKNNMYMIMSWTLTDRYKKYGNTFKLIQNSFKILPDSEI